MNQMFNFALNQYFIALLVTGIINFGLALFVILKGFDKRLNQIFALYSLSLFVWSIFEALGITRHSEPTALLLWRINHIGVIFIPVFLTHFIFILLGVEGKKKRLIPISYAIAGIFLILDATPLLISGVVPKFSFRYFINPGHLYYTFFGLWVFWAIFGNVELFKEYFRTTGYRRNQMKYFCWPLLFSYICGVPNFFPTFNIEIPILMPFGTYVIPVYALFTVYAILRYRLMDINIVLTRAGIFLFVYTFILGIPFWIGYHTKSWFFSTSLAVAFTTAGPFIYNRLRRKAEDVILARQRQYQRFLLNAAKAMVRERDLKRLFKLIVIITKRGIKPEFAAVFLHDEEHDRYVLGAVRKRGIIPNNLSIPVGHKIIDLMKKAKAPLSQEDFHSIFPDIRQGLPIHLIVPVCTDGKLLGFLMLGEKLDGSAYSDDDISVFRILSQQAALAIEYCIFLEEDKKFRERFAKVEKLSTFGDMASCAAHQFGNRLTAFSNLSLGVTSGLNTFMKKFESSVKESQEFKDLQVDFNGIAMELAKEVKSCRAMIRGYLDYAGEQKTSEYTYFSLRECIDLAMPMLIGKHKFEPGEFPFEFILDLGKDDTIYGVKSSLTEVMFNFIDNSYEAIKDKINRKLEEKHYKPFIKIEFEKDEFTYLIKISDNGIGIKDEIQNKIFSPFFTTRATADKSGTGIGTYVAWRTIVEQHRGSISFKSKYTKGVTFFIKIPTEKELARIKKKEKQEKYVEPKK